MSASPFQLESVADDYAMLRQWWARMVEAPDGAPPADVPLDVLAWTNHLLWLKSQLDARLLDPRELEADEAEGLRILAELVRRAETQRSAAGSKACPRCGGLSRSRFVCTHCGGPLKG